MIVAIYLGFELKFSLSPTCRKPFNRNLIILMIFHEYLEIECQYSIKKFFEAMKKMGTSLTTYRKRNWKSLNEGWWIFELLCAC